jgi:hypothetical protein
MIGIVYKIQNKLNGKIYIGKTTNEKRRLSDHKSLSKKTKTKFYNAVRKYGWDNFEYSIIEKIDKPTKKELDHSLSFREIFYINELNTIKKGYNTTIGGEGVCGLLHSEESKKKMSDKRKYLYETNQLNRHERSIIQLDENNNFIKEWVSIKSAETLLNLHRSHIIGCCKFQRRTCGGFRWVYKDEYGLENTTQKLNKKAKEDYLIINARPLYKLNLNGDIIKAYITSGEASLDNTGTNSRNIRMVCQSYNNRLNNIIKDHSRYFCGGFRWVYKEDYDDLSKREILLYFFNNI